MILAGVVGQSAIVLAFGAYLPIGSWKGRENHDSQRMSGL